MMKCFVFCCCLSFINLVSVFASEEGDLTQNLAGKQAIVFGQTGSFSGHLGLYGNLIKNAINARFKRINEEGGINGVDLRLESMEDYGDPVLAKKNIVLLKKKNVDMFLGCMGVRSILSLLPMIKNKEMAMFFPWGGHDLFRDPKLSNIVNGLGYLQPQLEMIVENIVEKRGFRKIAIFHADDDFSVDAVEYLEKILQNYGLYVVGKASYNRMTIDVVPSVERLLAVDPKVVICISTSMPAVKLIGHFFKRGHYATEFVGVDSALFVKDILKDKGAHFCFTSSVPDPRVDTSEIARQYRQDIDKYHPDDMHNILSFAYYISAAIIVEAIRDLDGKITKESIINRIESMKNFDIGGFKVNFNAEIRHIFSSDVFLING